MSNSQDPIIRLLTSFYRDKLGLFARLSLAIIGILGGVTLISTALEVLLNYEKSGALIYGTMLYTSGLLIAFLIYGAVITRSLFKNPRQLFGLSTELEHLLNEWMSKLYRIERTTLKESCVIEIDGSHKSSMEYVITATAENVNALEIYSAYFGPVPDRVISLESVRVTPKEFSPIELREVLFMKGWYQLRFPKDLPTDRSVTIEYEEQGGPDTFATSPELYVKGIHFEYLVKTMFYPTRTLTIDIFFKPGYALSTVTDRPRAVVWYGNAKVEHATETLRAGRYFRYDDRRAILRIPAPILGLQYAVRWSVDYPDELP